jgi:serine/threonine-protein kinase
VKAEHWQRVQALFHRAIELAPVERAALLDAECGADAGLRAEVERLLRSDESGGDVFSRLEPPAPNVVPDPLLGRTLGAYRLTERIAAGGMGVVYRGERADGLFEQEVAIKLIRAERATEWTLRHFEFERRTLAALQHPCIARLFDGGTTAEGWPYFVMEFVHGESIDRYCERERLPLAARLALFLQVCRAVHCAHQNLIVHCDLKPSNILIDERGLPRLLDFGIARLREDASAELTPVAERTPAATRTIAHVLTPEYASPEQLAGGPVTTSIDVYALGVILYELLTGQRPFESSSRSPAAWERLIHETTPEPPSTRVGRAAAAHDSRSIATSLRSTPAGARRALRGDLDRIVLMALRKEPDRRYSSVQEFSADIERHLAGLPVRARADSLGYRSSKFVQRNRVAVAASVVVLAALLLGLYSARRSARSAEAEALHARIESDSFQSIANFLMDAFLPTQPAQDEAWQQRARLRIRAHVERVRRQYAGQDHQRANLLDTLGRVCLRLDLHEDAEQLLHEAESIREQTFGRDSLEHALSLRSLGQLAYQQGNYAQAAEWLGQALAIQRGTAQDTHTEISALANDLGACLCRLGRYDEAEALHREALALRRAASERSLPVAESLNNLSAVHQARAQHELAIADLREALELRESILGTEHLLTLQTVSNLAGALWQHGEQAEAQSCMQRAETGYRALDGDGENELGLVLANLATMQTADGDLANAALSLSEALALQTKRLGPDHSLVAVTLAKLAVLQHAQRREEEARASWEQVLRIRRAAPDAPRELADGLYGYAVFLSDLGECEEAGVAVEEALGLQRSHGADDTLALGRMEHVFGLCLQRLRLVDAAREHLTEAARLIGASAGAVPGEVERVQRRLDELDR